MITNSSEARDRYGYTFINLGVPYTKLTSESDTVNNLDSTTGLAFTYGKRVSKRFAIEFSYIDHAFTETEINPGFPASFESELKLTEMMLGYQIFLNRYWAMRLGYNYASLSREFSDTGLTPAQIDLISYDKTFHTFYFGLMGSFQIYKAIGMYLDFLYSSTDAYNKTSAGAGLQIRF